MLKRITVDKNRRISILMDAALEVFPGSKKYQAITDDILSIARSSQHRILEAEGLLLRGKSFWPAIDLTGNLDNLQLAQQIFRANNLSHKAAECQIAIARVLYELGEDISSVIAANGALFEPLLSADNCVLAHCVIATALARMGEFDNSLKCLSEQVMPLVEQSKSTYLRPYVLWVKAVVLLRLAMYRGTPALWHGLSNAPPVSASIRPIDFIIELLDNATALLPVDVEWRYIALTRHLTNGLFGQHAPALTHLSSIASQSRVKDPPLALRALAMRALVLSKTEDHVGALASLNEALALADSIPFAGTYVLEIWRQLAYIHERIGNANEALLAQKQFSHLQLARLTYRPILRQTLEPDSYFINNKSYDPTPLRAIEPALLRLATRYIEDNLDRKISVADIARHCQLGRRTLEVAFQKYKGTTVMSYLNGRRLTRAADSFMYTNSTVAEVAASLGYESAVAFNRVFRKHFGMTPRQWIRTRTTPAQKSS